MTLKITTPGTYSDNGAIDGTGTDEITINTAGVVTVNSIPANAYVYLNNAGATVTLNSSGQDFVYIQQPGATSLTASSDDIILNNINQTANISGNYNQIEV